MKIIVADDEYYVRYSIVSMIYEIYEKNVEIIEVENGEELIDVVKESHPDIVFVDIKMPKINGLEAIEEGKKYSENTEWIIISGYSDFKFAQQAIRLGAHDYITKPVSIEVLKKVIKEVDKKNNNKHKAIHQEFCSRAIAALNYLKSPDELEGFVKCSVFYHMDYENWEDKKYNWNIIENYINEMCEKYTDNKIKIGFVYFSMGYPGLFSWYKEGMEDEVNIIFLNLYKDLDKLIKEYDLNEHIVIYETRNCMEFKQLQKELKKLEEYEFYRMLFEDNSVINLETLERICNTNEDFIKFCKTIKQILIDYESKDYLKCDTDIQLLRQIYNKDKIVISINMFLNLKEYLKNTKFGKMFFSNISKDKKIDTIEELINFLENIQWNKKELESHDIIEEMIEHISLNYDKDISIGFFADYFSITPNYLSTLFKNSTNKTFVKYLTNIRIKKAKELLQSSKFTVGEISKMVGYNDSKYFIKVFKGKVGVTPGEYINKTRKTQDNMFKK